ncbi:hypothetical protein, partial [Leptospira gomenensis]|uniref:hypothetical protein n=1 Tax=Leptospira gomenensis TaxID=2484974 RepID=UPI001AF001EE
QNRRQNEETKMKTPLIQIRNKPHQTRCAARILRVLFVLRCTALARDNTIPRFSCKIPWLRLGGRLAQTSISPPLTFPA